jgi:predicted O-linked N-acetylglucosamine transferase (SPINDLY family)
MPPPSSAAAHRAQQAWVQGQAFARQGRWRDAAVRFEQATRLQPRDVLYFLNLADAQIKSGQDEAALAVAAAARRAEPGNALALTLQANALLRLNRHEALADLLQAAPAALMSPELRAMQAGALVQCGDPRKALSSYLQALTARPADANLHLKLGQAFNGLGMKREAAECLRTALLLGLGTRQVAVHDLLAFYEREVCDWRGGDTQVQALRASIAQLPADAAVETNPFAHVTLLDDPLEQLRAAREHARTVQSTATPLPPRRAVARERLRIGYVSADFQRHATAYLMAELFERHDRGRFESFLYSLGRDDGSATRQRLRAAGDHFIDVQGLSSRALAERIRADGIDILVDLKGYTLDARPAVFAYRPAPVQVAYLGFPGTSGADFIDYIVGDPQVTPLAHAAHYSEKIAQLPGCYQCNDGTRALPRPPSRASQGLPQDALVLCGFNQPYKISPAVFDVWCRLLHELPRAVLWLLAWTPQAPEALRAEAARRGIDARRLVFAGTVDQATHLDRVACADLFVDTWPCNAHTTASDMLWAGVPVLTFSGRSFASRVAGSLLHAVGAPELVCADVASYQALALALGRDDARRQALRTKLEAARQGAPLFSGASIAPQLEALYERMWSRALAGLPPEALPAAA